MGEPTIFGAMAGIGLFIFIIGIWLIVTKSTRYTQ